MSDHWLRYVPTDPRFQPTASAAAKAEALLSSFLPKAEEVRSKFTETVSFIDAGSNWSGVACIACGAEGEDWWSDAMSIAAESDFARLDIQAPCCGASVSLNELRYGWPVGFGRFVLEAMNPDSKGLTAQQSEQLAATLGCSVREIRVHV